MHQAARCWTLDANTRITPSGMTQARTYLYAVAAAAAMDASIARADSAQALLPDQFFVQAGKAEDATALGAGLIWQSGGGRFLGEGYVSLYWEVSLGRWSAEQADGSRHSSWVTQLGVTPVLRWTVGSESHRWFIEGGIGANLLLPVYRSREKRFSTSFNFGDHLGVGLQFGEGDRHEVVLRFQHFSNGGIKRPNPGEDFVQVRYVMSF
jgi:lipid A 3-O-deacylase